MSISYENCFFKRIWNKLFHKVKYLDVPVQYTPKEVKLKIYDIIGFLSGRV